jgi:hypothetical protein
MGLRFRKSIKLAKGLKLNISKTGLSVTVGRRGLHGTINTHGQITGSAGLPGTGVSYVKTTNLKKLLNNGGKKKTAAAAGAAAAGAAAAGTARGSDSAGQETEAGVEETRASAEQQVEAFDAALNRIRLVHKVNITPIDWQAIHDAPSPSSHYAGTGSAQDSFKEDLQEASQGQYDSAQDWQTLHDLSARVLAGDIDAYMEVINEAQPFADLEEYGSEFECGTDRPDAIEVEFDVKADEVVPDQRLTLTSTGKVSQRAMAKSVRNDIVQDYVCSTVIRTAREMFALLPVQQVLVNATDKVINTATGHEEEVTLVSVLFDRDRFLATNFDMIDPSDLIEAYPSHMSCKKSKGMSPVERMEL